MSEYLFYLIQVSCCFVVLYGLFYLLFRQLTFHKVNRIILLLLIPFSFALPLAHFIIPNEAVAEALTFVNIEEFVFETENSVNALIESNTQRNFQFSYFLNGLYWIGFALCLARLLFSVIKLFSLKRKSPVLQRGKFQFLIADVSSIFSCFNWIFIPKEQLGHFEEPVFEHEKAHARLGHTLDLILAELFIAICWFNPCAYFFRKSIRSVHEFQADQAVLQQQIKKSAYLRLLLNNLVLENPNKLYSYFNHPIIKKRIDMIIKPNSKRKNILRYFLLVPIVSLLSMAFIEAPQEPNRILFSQNTIIKENEPPSIFPLKNQTDGVITSPFKMNRMHPVLKKKMIHWGIDIKADEGTPVVATADGTISVATFEKNWGNLVVISHADGYETWYAHLQKFDVTENQKVKKGQVIAYTGNTGLSMGPHLHYEVRKDGKKLDPMDFFEKMINE